MSLRATTDRRLSEPQHPISTVPFVDLVGPHRQLREDLRAVFEQVLDMAHFAGGPLVEAFEQDFAEVCGTQFCIGMSNGTDALRLALVAAGIRPGDTVVAVPLTFIATTEAISQAGAQFDLVDIHPRTYTMDPAQLQAYLERGCTRDPETGRPVSRRTGRQVTAVVPVHLYGQMADMDPIRELAVEHGLTVVEDACQAHGAEYFSARDGRWRRAGSMGRAAAFSFYPTKNLGACGEAGAVTTSDEQLARRCRMLRDHGQVRKYVHAVEGWNGRLDALQAGILQLKLRHLAKWNEQRRELARRYQELFDGTARNLVLPHEPTWSRPVYHLYVIGTADRNRLQQELAAAGIGTGIHYPTPLHLLEPYRDLGFRRGEFPVAERVANEVLSLPMYPELTPAQQRHVTDATLRSLAATIHDPH